MIVSVIVSIDGSEILHNETLDVIPLNDYKKVCNSGTIYIVLFTLFFITSVCITGVYYIGYITIKSISDYENIYSVNPRFLIIAEVDGYIEENNGNRNLTFASTDKNKKLLEKYT